MHAGGGAGLLDRPTQHAAPGIKSKKGKEGLLSKLFFPSAGSSLFARRSCPPPSASNSGVQAEVATAAPSSAFTQQQNRPSAPSAMTSASSCAQELIQPIWLGYARDMPAHYSLGPEIGKGGNGVVRHCVEAPVKHTTSCSYACKTVPKIPKDPQKMAKHLDNLRHEISMLMRLQGSLNIIKLEAVFEDEDSVHIIMENCQGGELASAVGQRHYSERTAASYMRAVLRTLAQCHAHNVLHRDIKPGNFMLLSQDECAPVKAIDLGLAVPFERDDLPLTNLGLEGTPWFMAPEALASEFYPASDVWSAGVMAHQLLTGKLPFNDKRNPHSPSLTAVWRSVLNDSLDFNKPWWEGMSDEAKDFVQCLLNRDHTKRPSAKEALKHPWLQGNSSQRSVGKQLQQSVVARIQRFGTKSALKRSVLQMIAAELLSQPQLVSPLSPASSLKLASGQVIAGPSAPALKDLLRHFQVDDVNEQADASQVARALRALGLQLDDSEVERLFSQLDIANTGEVGRSMVAASQVDWRYLQQSHKETWLQLARLAFSSLDTDHDGILRIDEIVARLSKNLPEAEVTAAVEHALEEAGQAGETQGLVFSDFVSMLKCGSEDSLDIYDQRRGSRGGGSASIDRLNRVLHVSVSASSFGDYSRHGAQGTEGSTHSTLLSPRTGDPTSNGRLFDWDPSMHNGHNNSSHMGCEGLGSMHGNKNEAGSSNRGSTSSHFHGNSSPHNYPNSSNNSYDNATPTHFAIAAVAAPQPTPTPSPTTSPLSRGTISGAIAAAARPARPAAPTPLSAPSTHTHAPSTQQPQSSTLNTGTVFRFDVPSLPPQPTNNTLPAAAAYGSTAYGSTAYGSTASSGACNSSTPSAWWSHAAPSPVASNICPTNRLVEVANTASRQQHPLSKLQQAPAHRMQQQAATTGEEMDVPPLTMRMPDGRHHGSSLYKNLAKCKAGGLAHRSIHGPKLVPLSTVRE